MRLKKADYVPLKGFYDLRAFDIPAKEFVSLWKAQKFMFHIEQKRLEGQKHPQIDEIRDFSAKVQGVILSYPIVKPELI